jgi:hypothetical protein
VKAEVVGLHSRTSHHIGPSQDISKLTDIAGPSVASQDFHGVWGHMSLWMELSTESLSQNLKIFGTLTKRGKLNTEDRETKEQIFSKVPS